MLITEINGTPATMHPAARVFIEEGFAATAMGIQARTERLRPRGYGSLDASGIGIAATTGGGGSMAESRTSPTFDNSRPRAGESSETERDRVRSSNDEDQELEREGIESSHNRGYDEAVRGGQDAVRRGDVAREDLGDVDDGERDPDSAFSDVDRDDTIDD
jgi:hypothetical protein